MRTIERLPHALQLPVAFVCNMALAYVAYWLCRLIYWAENAGALSHFWENSLRDIFVGAWYFDTSAILYTNALFALLMLIPLPLRWRESRVWQRTAKWVFVVVNGLAVVVNLADAAYFPYTGRRTTTTVFQEFSAEGNLLSIFGIELLRHWYLVIAAAGIIALLWRGYSLTPGSPSPCGPTPLPLPCREGSGHHLNSLTPDPSPKGEGSSHHLTDGEGEDAPQQVYTPLPTREGQGGGSAGEWSSGGWSAWSAFGSSVFFFLLFIPLCVAGMRGGWTTAVRPITVSNAAQYVNHPAEAAVILNTPFALIRTIGKAVFVVPQYYESEAELEAVYSPIHGGTAPSGPSISRPTPLPLPVREGSSHHLTDQEGEDDPQQVYTPLPLREGQGGGSAGGGSAGEGAAGGRSPNIVILIIESFGREYIGALNETLEGGRYAGYTPFVDSLCRESATFRWSFCNGRKSIDAMPSILSSIPMFIEPFVLTPASMNDVGGLAATLGRRGYETAFFHGAENGSMGFQAFARKTGFQRYYGRTEYNADRRFGGDNDFDGTWAIWDEPFLQFYAATMNDMHEPFMTALFTASSHHPYAVPEAYRDTFPEEGIVIHKCIRYTDHALRRFFESARRQPWFDHTLFVITSDHTNLSDHDFYQTDIGGFCSPIIFYDPSGRLFAPGRRESVAQHTDIMPTILGRLGSDEPYLAFGCDLFATPPDSTWAVNYNGGIYQYVRHGLLLQFDPAATSATWPGGGATRAVYELSDSLLRRNIVEQRPEQQQMERELRAIIQQYMSRMTTNRLVP